LITILAERPESLRLFHANPWQFQQTFSTPLKDLNRFVSAIFAPFSWERGAFSTDEVVFEPHHLLRLMAENSIHVENFWALNLEAHGEKETAELLEAALGDWVDFVFLPVPESIAIYADHDEYITFYAKGESVLSTLKLELIRAGFKPIEAYERGRSTNKLR
jgi:hypothetical protein